MLDLYDLSTSYFSPGLISDKVLRVLCLSFVLERTTLQFHPSPVPLSYECVTTVFVLHFVRKTFYSRHCCTFPNIFTWTHFIYGPFTYSYQGRRKKSCDYIHFYRLSVKSQGKGFFFYFLFVFIFWCSFVFWSFLYLLNLGE